MMFLKFSLEPENDVIQVEIVAQLESWTLLSNKDAVVLRMVLISLFT